MLRRGGLPLFIGPCGVRLIVVRPVRSEITTLTYQCGSINKGRSPQNCIECGCVSVRPSDAILRDDVLILESVLNFIKQVNSLLLRLISASLRLFSASIHFGNLKIARYTLHPQNEYLLKNSPQIISK